MTMIDIDSSVLTVVTVVTLLTIVAIMTEKDSDSNGRDNDDKQKDAGHKVQPTTAREQWKSQSIYMG